MYHGSLGGVWIGTEATYGTVATTLVAAPGISAALNVMENRQKTPLLGGSGGNDASVGVPLGVWTEGALTFGMVKSRANIGPVYVATGGSLTSQTYTWGPGTGTVGATAMSAACSYATTGMSYTFTGLVGRSITWDLRQGGEYATITVDVIGRKPTKTALTAPTMVAQADLQHTGSLAAIGGITVGHMRSASITFARSVSGMERQKLASTVLPEPVLHAERPIVSASIEVDFDASVVTLLDTFLAGAAVGSSITVGGFTILGPTFVGQLPQLQRGQLTATLNVQATSLTLGTEA